MRKELITIISGKRLQKIHKEAGDLDERRRVSFWSQRSGTDFTRSIHIVIYFWKETLESSEKNG
ncbi:MAG: hypothetical protein ACLS61_11405 [Ruminococcus sp.]